MAPWRTRGIRGRLFCLAIEILGRPRCLVDEPIGLAFRVTRDAANTFLHFAAHVPGGTGYTIFIHRSVLSWSDFASLQATMKRFVRNENRSGITVVAPRAEQQTATEGGLVFESGKVPVSKSAPYLDPGHSQFDTRTSFTPLLPQLTPVFSPVFTAFTSVPAPLCFDA
jgi:hypothetical protein